MLSLEQITDPTVFLKALFIYPFVAGCGFFSAGLIAAMFYKIVARIFSEDRNDNLLPER